jgi:hypothetical protein
MVYCLVLLSKILPKNKADLWFAQGATDEGNPSSRPVPDGSMSRRDRLHSGSGSSASAAEWLLHGTKDILRLPSAGLLLPSGPPSCSSLRSLCAAKATCPSLCPADAVRLGKSAPMVI